MHRAPNDYVRVFISPKHPVLGVNVTIQEEVGFIRKLDIIQEFVIVDLLQKPLAHGYPPFHIGLGQLVLDLDPVRIKFEVLNQNPPNRR